MARSAWWAPLGLLAWTACGAATPRAATLDLGPTLAAIDPGPSVPLVLDVRGAERAALAASPESLDELETRARTLRTTASNIDPAGLLRSALLVELRAGAQCDLACARALSTYYGLLVRIEDIALPALSLDPTLAPLVPRVGERYRWAVATALRATDDTAVRGEILRDVAAGLAAHADHAGGRALAEVALRVLTSDTRASSVEGSARPDRERSADVLEAHVDLAYECYALGDVLCGDRESALVVSLSAPDAPPERLAAGRDAGATLSETEHETGTEALLRRAAALIELRRLDEARAVYEALVVSAPTDARPHTQLALLELEQHVFTLTSPGVIASIGLHLRAGAWLEHRDAAYYGLRVIEWQFEAIATANAAAGQPVTPAVLASDVDQIVSGFAPLDPGAAAAFEVWARFMLRLLATAGADLDTTIAETTRATLDARERFPDDPHLARLALTFGITTDEENARRALSHPMLELAALEQSARYLAAVRWNDVSLLPDVPPDGELGALVQARRATDAAAWAEVAARYRTLLVGAAEPDRARLADGLAVALFLAGDAEAARRSLDGLSDPIAAFNRLAIDVSSPPTAEWLAAMRALLDGSRHEHVRCLAAIALSRRAALTDQAREQICTDPRVQHAVDIAADGRFSFDFRRRDGLTSSASLPLTAWLVVPLDAASWAP